MTKSQMIKRIICLALCTILCFVGIFFVPIGKTRFTSAGSDGEGVEDHIEFVRSMRELPTVKQYFDNDMSKSEHMTAMISESIKFNCFLKGQGSRREAYIIDSTIYYGESAVYGRSVVEQGQSILGIKDTFLSVVSFDVEFYFAYNSAYFKFNKYEYYEEDSTNKKTEPTLYDKSFEAIREYYNEWIEFYPTTQGSLTENSTKKLACESLRNEHWNNLISIINGDKKILDMELSLKSILQNSVLNENNCKKTDELYVYKLGNEENSDIGNSMTISIDITNNKQPMLYVFQTIDLGQGSAVQHGQFNISNINSKSTPINSVKGVDIYKVFDKITKEVNSENN